jgi:hypothetical protein
MLLARASYFALDEAQALAVLAEVHAAVSNWRQVALSPEVGLRRRSWMTSRRPSSTNRWMPPPRCSGGNASEGLR